MTLSRDIYTPEELALELRISKRKVLNEIAAKRLAAKRLGRNVIRIWRDDVSEWLERHCDPSRPMAGSADDSDLAW